jgi:serpin B
VKSIREADLKNKNGMTVIRSVFFCLLLAACVSNAGETVDSHNIVKVGPKELLAPEYGRVDPAARAVARGANDFAFRLSAELVKNTGGANFVCSPYSVWMPLAALINATDDQYKAALLTALGAGGIAEADINRTASRMLYNLTKMQNKDSEGYSNPLKIANAIFVENKVTLRRDFVQTFMDYYRGSSLNVDFSSRDAVDAVNRWASENTEGLINEVVQKFDQDTVAALVNAIYFSDKWSIEFDREKTREGVFHAPAGNSTASFMIREGGQSYYEDESVQAVRPGYKEGGGMYIILPKAGGAAEFLASMTTGYFDRIRANLADANVKLLLPRFTIESDIMDLKKALVTLGVPLFDEVAAPLTGGLIEEDIPLCVTDAVQKALVKVDEEGATAAAVTVIVVGVRSVRPGPRLIEMICDRPFVFILCEDTYDSGGDQILFTGVVNRP